MWEIIIPMCDMKLFDKKNDRFIIVPFLDKYFFHVAFIDLFGIINRASCEQITEDGMRISQFFDDIRISKQQINAKRWLHVYA